MQASGASAEAIDVLDQVVASRLFTVDAVNGAALRAVQLGTWPAWVGVRPLLELTCAFSAHARFYAPALVVGSDSPATASKGAVIARWFVGRRPSSLMGYSMFHAALSRYVAFL